MGIVAPMNLRPALPLWSALILLALPALAADPRPQSIFNGRDLTGWKDAANNKFWRADKGILIGENDDKLSGNYLWTEQSYGNFILDLEVRWTGEIDSGVEFRKPAIQLQFGVSRSLKKDMSGSFYIGKGGYPEAAQVKEAAKLIKPEGQWNWYHLEARGSNFKVWINGALAVDYTNDSFAGPAPLGLQLHKGVKMKVEYRNLRAAALP